MTLQDEIDTLREEEALTEALLERSHTPRLAAHLSRIATRLYDRRFRLAAVMAIAAVASLTQTV